MNNAYSQYFQSLYDQSEPVGNLGRGVHYSVLRSALWHSPGLAVLSEAVWHDFAVIWDEDHDTRIVPALERIYLTGLLSPIVAIGERKGMLSVQISGDAESEMGSKGVNRFQKKLASMTLIESDPWPVEVETFGRGFSVIDTNDDDARVYLTNIDLLWSLGSKSPTFSPS